MKKTIRIAALLLALLMCVAVLASCGDSNSNTTSTTVAQSQNVDPASTEPAFPTANYNGDTFTIYARNASTYSHSGIYAEEQTGDVVNDQTLKRNQKVEAKYSIKFAIKEASDPYKTLETDIRSDSVDYDLLLDRRSSLKNPILSGLLQDWHTTSVDFSSPWWDANCAVGYDINGKMYMAVNDVSTANLTSARFLYFNKKVVDDYHLDNPYTLVKDNQWTLDNYINMVKSVSNPSEVEGELGVYGMLRETGASNGNHMHFMTGCGITLVKFVDGQIASNVDDSMILKMQDITDKLSTVLTKDYTMTYSEVADIDKSTGDLNNYNKGRRNFAEGHFLFVQNGMGVADQFTTMTDGLGVVPNPKYNADQTRYYHMVDKYSLIWAIPKADNIDLDRLATISDYWAYCSTDTVMESFYEVVTKGKRTQDPTAGENLDIVKSTITYELAGIFDLGLTDALDEGYTSKNVSAQFSNNRAIATKITNLNNSLDALG